MLPLESSRVPRGNRHWYAYDVAEGEAPNIAFGQYVSLGGRLRRLREAAGLPQEELAGRAALTAKAVTMLERGDYYLDVDCESYHEHRCEL